MNIDDNDKSKQTDDLKLDLDSQLSQDFSLDTPDLEPASIPETTVQKSQAVKDLEDMEDLQNQEGQAGGSVSQSGSKSSEPILSAAKAKVKKTKQAPAPSGPRGYRWFFVHFLSLLGLVAWSISSFIQSQPYRWEAVLITLAVIVLTIPTMRTFHVRTRAGLAGLGAALGLAVCSLYDPDTLLLPGVPLAFAWLLILTATWFWLIWAILRNEDMRKNKVALVLSALLLYPLLAPIFALVDGLLVKGLPISDFTLKYINESPEFLTIFLPWFFWPMTILAFLIPPLAAIFLLKDQLSYKKTDPDQYHLGSLWLALAGFVVLIYSIFSINPIAEDYPNMVSSIRNLWPAASQYQETQAAKIAAATQASLPKPKPTTVVAPTTDTAAETASTDTATGETATSETGEPAAGAESEASASPSSEATTPADQTATDASTPETAPPADETLVASDTSASQPLTSDGEATQPDPSVTEFAPTESTEATASQGETTSDANDELTTAQPLPLDTNQQAQSLDAQIHTTPEQLSSDVSADSGDQNDDLMSIMPKTLEVGPTDSRFAPVEDDSSSILVLDPETNEITNETPDDVIQRLTNENTELNNDKVALLEQITNLNAQIAVLKAQNELLNDRMHNSDQVIFNLTTPR
jgi:hypothetical protein